MSFCSCFRLKWNTFTTVTAGTRDFKAANFYERVIPLHQGQRGASDYLLCGKKHKLKVVKFRLWGVFLTEIQFASFFEKTPHPTPNEW